jgi:hypothetical protein
MFLHRGFKVPDGFDFDAMSDFVFTDKGFISTSLQPRIAQSFSNHASGRTAVFKILARKGQKGVYVDRALGRPADDIYEAEVLLPRGTTFRFNGKSYYDAKLQRKVYEVEIDPPSTGKP